MTLLSRLPLIAAVLLGGPLAARADGWLVVEAPAAIPVSEPQATVFRAGALPAVGAYTDHGIVALGLRLRAGVLRSGDPPANGVANPGLGGLASAGLALRLTAHGLWIEGVAGGGLTGVDGVPVVEAGAGWDFSVGSFAVGPTVRYIRLIEHDATATLGSAGLVLVGVELRIGVPHLAAPAPVEQVVRAAPPPLPPPPPEPAPPPIDRDPDRIVEREASCASDIDGCEVAPQIFVHDDRIVLEDRVLFDTDRADIAPAGRDLIGELARAWRVHPEWRRVTIEGHADVRGSDTYNAELSRRRAEVVRDQLVGLGFDRTRIDVIGYGRSRPRDPGTSTAAHRRNRRVEFVIAREKVGVTP